MVAAMQVLLILQKDTITAPCSSALRSAMMMLALHAFMTMLEPHIQAWCGGAGNADDADAGLATPLEVWQGLAAEGYQLSYRRVPLSRERTPEAADLDTLHQQLMTQPVGTCETLLHCLAACDHGCVRTDLTSSSMQSLLRNMCFIWLWPCCWPACLRISCIMHAVAPTASAAVL